MELPAGTKLIPVTIKGDTVARIPITQYDLLTGLRQIERIAQKENFRDYVVVMVTLFRGMIVIFGYQNSNLNLVFPLEPVNIYKTNNPDADNLQIDRAVIINGLDAYKAAQDLQKVYGPEFLRTYRRVPKIQLMVHDNIESAESKIPIYANTIFTPKEIPERPTLEKISFDLPTAYQTNIQYLTPGGVLVFKCSDPYITPIVYTLYRLNLVPPDVSIENIPEPEFIRRAYFEKIKLNDIEEMYFSNLSDDFFRYAYLWDKSKLTREQICQLILYRLSELDHVLYTGMNILTVGK